jgi:hypothetical protein
LTPSQRELLGVVQALNTLGLQLGPAKSRHQHSGQNGDNRDNDEQFNKGKTNVPIRVLVTPGAYPASTTLKLRIHLCVRFLRILVTPVLQPGTLT